LIPGDGRSIGENVEKPICARGKTGHLNELPVIPATIVRWGWHLNGRYYTTPVYECSPIVVSMLMLRENDQFQRCIIAFHRHGMIKRLAMVAGSVEHLTYKK
jgi:hypothetical protein